MFCPRCGQKELDAATFCLNCGLEFIAPARPTTATRPYLWGKIQGWALIVFFPLVAISSLATASTDRDYKAAVAAAIFSLLTVPMGIGILKKRRFGLILVYVTLGLICLSVVVGFTHGLEAAHSAALGSVIWVASTIYYHKRREEFR